MELHRRSNRTDVTIDELRSKQENKQRRRTAFYVLLFLGIVIVFLAVSFFQFFRVSEINVTGFQSYTEEQILENVAIEKGDNLFSFNPEEISETLYKALPYLGSVKVTRKWPSTVNIDVEERTVAMTMRAGDDAYLLSADLHVLGKIGANEIVPGVTRLTAGAVIRCLVGDTLEFRENRMGRDLNELSETIDHYNLRRQIASIDMTSRFDIYLNYDNRFTVYLADIENVDLKIRFLTEILTRLEPGSKGTIDLSDPREASVRIMTESMSQTPEEPDDESVDETTSNPENE